MSAFNDGRCAKCDRRISWTGEVADKPACPHCGHEPDTDEIKELKEIEEKMEEMRNKMLEDDDEV